jgi:hypothetical protein
MSEATFDKRIVIRKIKRGDVQQNDYDQFMNELDDCSEVADEIETKFIRKVESKEQEENNL